MSREQSEPMPDVVRLRDTGLRDDLGGSGQRIITTAGNGYVKTEYVRRDIVDQLRAQLAAAEEAQKAHNDRYDRLVQYAIELDTERDKERTRAERAEARVAELERDGERFDAIRDNAWALTPFDMPTGGGDADIGWAVTEKHVGINEPVQVAIVYEDNPRKAIAAALYSQGA